MRWSAGSSPQPFIMGTVLPLLLPFILSLWLCVVGWGRGWEGYHCTTVRKIQYLHSNPLFSTVLNFHLRGEKKNLCEFTLVDLNPNCWCLLSFTEYDLVMCILIYLLTGRLTDWWWCRNLALEWLGDNFNLSSW